MKIKNDIKSISYLKSHAPELLMQINETRRPIIITQKGEPRAVIQSPEVYEEMRNSLGLMKILAQGEKDVKEGKIINQDRLFQNIEERLTKK